MGANLTNKKLYNDGCQESSRSITESSVKNKLLRLEKGQDYALGKFMMSHKELKSPYLPTNFKLNQMKTE
jgi:hypothetical protein